VYLKYLEIRKTKPLTKINRGPVFNEKGELIGIATSSIDSVQTQRVFGATPQNVNFAIKSSYINLLLPSLPDTFIRKK
jgi:S1-C subfamily serine protease